MLARPRHIRLIASIVAFALVALVAMPTAAQEDTHTILRGETLYRIALRYGISVSALAQANGITDPSRIFAGQQLVIPAFNPDADVVENPTVAGTPIKYRVTAGDTLNSIAQRYGMTIDQLMQLNQLTDPNRILRGQELTVWSTEAVAEDPGLTTDAVAVLQPSDAAAPAPAVESVSHVVQQGEHLSQIANRYGVSWGSIVRANNITNPDTIYAGQRLTIPSPTTNTEAAISEPASASAFVPTPPTTYIGRQVVVDLGDQMLYAYQDGVLVRSVRVSTGLPRTPTVQGDYRVYRKYAAQTMSGPGYYLTDVPYVMYFYQGYALHGTYWHSNFGQPMSHGCVNLPTPEAEWLFTHFVDVGTAIHVTI